MTISPEYFYWWGKIPMPMGVMSHASGGNTPLQWGKYPIGKKLLWANNLQRISICRESHFRIWLSLCCKQETTNYL